MEDFIEKLKNISRKDRIAFKNHALARMLERRIGSDDVKTAIMNLRIIEEYKDDMPMPSFLGIGYHNERPLHVVFSVDSIDEMIYVITVYEPSPDLWEDNLISRRKK